MDKEISSQLSKVTRLQLLHNLELIIGNQESQGALFRSIADERYVSFYIVCPGRDRPRR